MCNCNLDISNTLNLNETSNTKSSFNSFMFYIYLANIVNGFFKHVHCPLSLLKNLKYPFTTNKYYKEEIRSNCINLDS